MQEYFQTLAVGSMDVCCCKPVVCMLFNAPIHVSVMPKHCMHEDNNTVPKSTSMALVTSTVVTTGAAAFSRAGISAYEAVVPLDTSPVHARQGWHIAT